jgi:hypothetical protein
MLYQSHGEIVYLGYSELLCIPLGLAISAGGIILTTDADSWSTTERSVSLDTERLVRIT